MVPAPSMSDDLVGRALVRATSEAIIACDGAGIIQLWSPGAERVFGHSKEEARGQSLDLIIPERFRSRHWKGFDATMRTGKSRYAEGALLAVPGLRRDGSLISIEFTIAPVLNEDQAIAGLVAVVRDVTKTFEELKSLRKKAAGAA